MGMKIRQESKVKTFFRRIFKISKKKDKDGLWKRLDKEVLYKLSRESGLDSLSTPSFSLDNVRDCTHSNVDLIDSKIPLTSIESVKQNADETKLLVAEEQTPTKTNKSKKGKSKASKAENRSVKGSPKERVNSDSVVKDKSKKKRKNKNYSELLGDTDLDNEVDTQDQDLLDIDLNLVLSSFPNVTTPRLRERTTAEADDNARNEQRIHQASPYIGSKHKVEVVIESPGRAAVVPGDPEGQGADETTSRDLERNADNWEILVVENDHVNPNPPKKKTKKSKKNRKSNPPKESIDNTSVALVETPQTESETKTKKFKNKKSRKRNRKSKKPSATETEDVPEGVYTSTDQLVCDNNVTTQNKEGHDEIPTPESDNPETDISIESLTPPEPKKKNKKNKKKGNVRRPEDDLAADLLEKGTRRPKHQMLWDSQDIITELESPEIPHSDEQVTGKTSKKMKRRRLKLKFNKEKKRLQFKRYDELDDKKCDLDSSSEVKQDKTSGAREVGRRMWRACKTGWKYLRAGLVYYTKSPAAGVSFTPIVQRYGDEFNQGNGNFASV